MHYESPEFNIAPEPSEEKDEFEADREYERRLTPEQRLELGKELSQLGDELASRIDEIAAEVKNAPEGERAEALQEELEWAKEELDALKVYADGIIKEQIH